jgi:hypothetical protein
MPRAEVALGNGHGVIFFFGTGFVASDDRKTTPEASVVQMMWTV